MAEQAHTALIERLEEATGPDRELDCAIADAITPPAERDAPNSFWCDGRLSELAREAAVANPPHYTASIDAALTLVPEAWRVYAIQNEQYPPSPARWFAGLDHIPHTESMIGKSPHPAIAICIAALKARATAAPTHKHEDRPRDDGTVSPPDGEPGA